MKNIHLLPTEKPSRLGYLTKKGKEVLKDLILFDKPMPNILDSENQHIYITSDEEIKQGDWIFNEEREPSVLQCIGKGSLRGWNKIILTTDQSLIQYGIEAIDDEFLEWFVNNPSCEEVKIEDYGNLYNFRYLILIPREETKTTNDVDINQRSYSEEDVKKMLHMCCDVLENNKKSFWNIDGLVDEIVLTFKQQEQ